MEKHKLFGIVFEGDIEVIWHGLGLAREVIHGLPASYTIRDHVAALEAAEAEIHEDFTLTGDQKEAAVETLYEKGFNQFYDIRNRPRIPEILLQST